MSAAGYPGRQRHIPEVEFVIVSVIAKSFVFAGLTVNAGNVEVRRRDGCLGGTSEGVAVFFYCLHDWKRGVKEVTERGRFV
jgi:hypothetical protein